MKGLSGRTVREMRLVILEREGIGVISIWGIKTNEESRIVIAQELVDRPGAVLFQRTWTDCARKAVLVSVSLLISWCYICSSLAASISRSLLLFVLSVGVRLSFPFVYFSDSRFAILDFRILCLHMFCFCFCVSSRSFSGLYPSFSLVRLCTLGPSIPMSCPGSSPLKCFPGPSLTSLVPVLQFPA
jgi:hypothetical protein